MIEFGDGTYVADREWWDPVMQRYFSVASMALTVHNDYCSWLRVSL